MSEDRTPSKSAIKELVKAYNQCFPNDTLVLHEANEVKDVSNLFVCVYDNNYVGLFNKLCFRKKKNAEWIWEDDFYFSDDIYVGYDSSHVGIKVLRRGDDFKNYWMHNGTYRVWDGKRYNVTCDMCESISFDDMRLIMYEAGELSTPYEFGKATQEQILQVLSFAKKYYSSNYQRKRDR